MDQLGDPRLTTPTRLQPLWPESCFHRKKEEPNSCHALAEQACRVSPDLGDAVGFVWARKLTNELMPATRRLMMIHLPSSRINNVIVHWLISARKRSAEFKRQMCLMNTRSDEAFVIYGPFALCDLLLIARFPTFAALGPNPAH